jgi:hypothetical protein
MKLFLAILGALLMAIAGIGGISIGLGLFAYSIYTIILLIKGTVAVSFFAVLKVVACWVLAALCGWLWFLIFGFLGGVCIASSK